MKKFLLFALAIGLFSFSPSQIRAQDQQPTPQPSAEELEKEKAERAGKAYRLLDQVIDEAQSLRLIENRVRVQITAADLLWKQNQGRARTLFSLAADGIGELGRQQAAASNPRPDEGFGPNRGAPRNSRVFQLRQELILAVARHDATLAYQLLASTKPPAVPQNAADQRRPRGMANAEDNLEQALLARIASLDPKLAAQNAEQMIDKGQFPRTLAEVLNQLHRQDPEAAAKLADKVVKKIQATNLLTSTDALTLSQSLLMFGPRQPAAPANSEAAALAQVRSRGPMLDQAAYVELLSSVVDAALKVTVPNNRTQGNPRRVPVTPGGPQQPTEAQMEQVNARRLLSALLPALPMVDQYLPAKAGLVRQKLTEAGMPSSPTAVQFPSLREDPTVDDLVQAAALAPQQAQARLYQRAAYKALEEGNTDRARQIATDHLSERVREMVMQRIDLLEVSKKGEGTRFDEIRQKIARLQTDREKLDLLIQAASDAQKSNPKLALQFLDEARQLTNRRAANYDHFEQQLRVARAYSSLDPARSFEVLDPGIVQLNELLAAASVLSGFEVSTFRDGEMTIIEGGGLGSYVTRFGRELAVLARSDFDRADTLAGRFQFLEPRIMTRLSIVQGLLDERASGAPRSTVATQTTGRPN